MSTENPSSPNSKTTDSTQNQTATAPPPEVEKPTRWFSCSFGPVVASAAEYEELFKNEKQNTYTDLNFSSKHGFVRFTSQADADLFIEHFNNFSFKGQPMWAEKSRKQLNTGKTLYLSGFTQTPISERSIWEALCDHGFIRRISAKRDFAFVEFDTPDEAQNVLDQFPTIIIDDQQIRLSFARNEHNPKLTIPLKELVPLDHPFWFQLQEMLYEQMPH
ncbi:hypothetical protein TRFO_06825 [Tritrichomonas foetus]|uniref:RRM domain-containing protein n=1 Tax=Tritrichomonas foetus TaxID=1144522 RepID=A0A1J4JVW9_9EUKA|nr:hypothetical protein TRFO_06825 [Tritrichomonas foetus]|eukprot:OHT03155.1 hypothetical protein TRFO_06825 [Tritrichomonas foetus]